MKHCVYCQEEIPMQGNVTTACLSLLNPVQPDTVGNKPHVYISTDWPPSSVQFYRVGGRDGR